MSKVVAKLQAQIEAEMKTRADLLALVEKETRGLTADEQKTLDASVAKVDELRKQVDSLVKADAQTKAAAVEIRELNEPEERSITFASKRSLSEKEREDMSRFSALRAARIALGMERSDGIEAEMMKEGQVEMRESGVNGCKGAFQLPSFLFFRQFGTHNRDTQKRAGLTNVTGLSGEVNAGGLVGTDIMGLEMPFFNESILPSLGARVLTGLKGNLYMPRLGVTNSPTVKTENGAATKIVPSFNGVTLQPFRIPSYFDITQQTLIQSSVSVDQAIQDSLLEQLAEKWTSLAINGAGTTESLGILNDPDLPSVAMGTNGGVLTHDLLVDLEEKVAVLNALKGTPYYLSNSKVRSKAKKTLAFAGVSQGTIWEQGNTMNSYPVGITNAVPSNLEKGEADTCSAVIFGNFKYLWLPQWGGADIIVDRVTQAGESIIRIHAGMFVDAGVIRKDSLAYSKDVLTVDPTT